MRGRHLLVASLLVLAMVTTGCYRWTTDQIEVAGKAPANVLVVIHRSPTNQLEGFHYDINKGNGAMSLTMMGDWVWSAAAKQRITKVGLAFSDFDYFFGTNQAADFNSAMSDIRNNSRCLALDRSWSPYTQDRHNWTTRPSTDTHCLIGKPFPLA